MTIVLFVELGIGDVFHAAPNIDHSQDFVRRDIKDWLNWLRNDIGFDGWRLDFVR
jgi:alpha-amylase